MSVIIVGAAIIDGVREKPAEGECIWIEGKRIKAIGLRDQVGVPQGATIIDVRGKYVIPGLMNANVHLLADVRLETLVRYADRYEDLIAEAAQVALKNGLTTVFDTWGPRRFLMGVRDRINAGELLGSRIFCAGNIIGFDGPLSDDFVKGANPASAALTQRTNAIWAENVGRHLMWMSPRQVAEQIRAYVARGIDFIKFASNDHFPGAFLAFSPDVQKAMVEEAHRASITAQAHTLSVEGVRVAIEAGCDLVTHCNLTGPVPIPESTLELFVKRKTGAVIFPWTKQGLAWLMENASDATRTSWLASDLNARNLIRSGAMLMLANDGALFTPDTVTDPAFAKTWAGAPESFNLINLGLGHFNWFKAMEEKECRPMEMLRAATRNIAIAYGKDEDLGTLEPGKIADLLILDRNPLQSAENYRSIHMILKEGAVVDTGALPMQQVLTCPAPPWAEEGAAYVPFLRTGRFAAFPACPSCSCTGRRE